jgi:calcineurin-like phosphoesterase family protein
MYKILKFNWNDRHRHYVVSDLHTYHDPTWVSPIWEMRGYKNAQECAEHQIQQINSRVGVDDILWNLGDNFLNSTDGQCRGWLSAIKCQNIKYLFGNHESNMYRMYKEEILNQYGIDDLEVYPLKMGNVEFIGNHQEVHIGKQIIVFNHFPLRIWHKDSRGAWMVSGHSHLQDKGRRPDAEFQKGVDAGWDHKRDVWSFSELEDIMSTKSIEILDHNRTH